MPYFFTPAALKVSSNSPLWNASVTMSQPPTNSPPTYSWGIVGHSLYALTPSRIESSSNTLTLSNSTPVAWSTRQTCCEKPHWGCCGVPFMYNITGVPSTCVSRRSVSPLRVAAMA